MTEYYRLPKLQSAGNYKEWERAIRGTLLANKLKKFLDPTHTPPARPLGAGEDKIITPAQEEAYVKARDEYDEGNELYLNGIQLTCAPSPYSHIERITSASEAWAKLKEVYGTDSDATAESAYHQLHTIDSDQFKSLSDYLSKFKELVNKLAGMGINIQPQSQSFIFKNGLPKSMESAVYTQYEMYRKNKEDVNLDYVTTSLMTLENPKDKDSNAYAGKFGKQSANKNTKGQYKGRN